MHFSGVHLGSRNAQGVQSYGPRKTGKTREKLSVLCIPLATSPPFIWWLRRRAAFSASCCKSGLGFLVAAPMGWDLLIFVMQLN
jgi:hypothetical protein